ncbi:MAG: glycogen synthase GlgA [Ignavibacteriaceae bacterium]|nr:glycogen synthase GlgA [Ignavibacteriaceae bacterium]
MAVPKKLKILFVTSELFPFVKTGGLADVSNSLPQVLHELGHEVRIMVPKYGAIDSRKFKIHDVVRLKDLMIPIGEKEVTFSIKSSFLPSPRVRVQIYFLENNEYFGNRKSLYTDPITGEDYEDNDERFILLNRAVFELILKLGWVPDIIHINDWQCGLIPAYFKTIYANEPQFQTFNILFTLHNLSYQGVFPKSTFKKTGLPEELNSNDGVLQDGKFSFMKSGLLFADYINTVSDSYAKEISSVKEISGGLLPLLTKRKSDIYGLVNGIDYSVWNPEKDPFLSHHYTAKGLEGKMENKRELVERFSLKFDPSIPVIGIISRLFDVKGIDLILESFAEIMKKNVQVVLLGTGEKKYQNEFEKLSDKYTDKFACYIGFNDELAHLIEAGADMYLMPSKFEPCGLNQMYSLVYGTVPIVRRTGGLADTVVRFDEQTEEGTGFVFEEYNAKELLKELNRALSVYENKKVWHKIIKNGMKVDFSWQASAKRYVELYKTILSGK